MINISECGIPLHLQKLILVSREFLELAEKNVSSQRPSWRVNAGKIDTQRDYVLILSDHSIFPHGNNIYIFFNFSIKYHCTVAFSSDKAEVCLISYLST